MFDAEILIVGKEIVTGYRQDANVLTLARYLVSRGISVRGVRMVSDEPKCIADAVASVRSSLLIVSGGLGSTRDDVTMAAVARAVGRRIVSDPEMKARVLAKLRRRGSTWAPRRRAFTRKPLDAETLPNSVGLAEGLFLPGKTAILMLPGVPAELEAIVREGLGDVLKRHFAAVLAVPPHVLGVAGLRETEIEDACLDLPEFRRGEVSILPSPGVVELVLRGDGLRDKVKRRLGKAIFTERGERLEEVVVERLRKRGETLATAESCTGGLLGAQLTEIPGVSAVYLGGVVTYADSVKSALLGVSPAILARHGAVSKPVAVAMARGIRKSLGADWGVSITGIAGPGGGTARKRVGLVYIAVAGARGTRVTRLQLGGDRLFIRRHAVRRALDLLRSQSRPGR